MWLEDKVKICISIDKKEMEIIINFDHIIILIGQFLYHDINNE